MQRADSDALPEAQKRNLKFADVDAALGKTGDAEPMGDTPVMAAHAPREPREPRSAAWIQHTLSGDVPMDTQPGEPLALPEPDADVSVEGAVVARPAGDAPIQTLEPETSVQTAPLAKDVVIEQTDARVSTETASSEETIAVGHGQQTMTARPVAPAEAEGANPLDGKTPRPGVNSDPEGTGAERVGLRTDTATEAASPAVTTSGSNATKPDTTTKPLDFGLQAMAVAPVAESLRPQSDGIARDGDPLSMFNDVRTEARLDSRLLAPAAPIPRPVTVDGADVIQQTVQAALSKTSGQKLELRLDPPELGKVEIDFDFSDEKLTIVVRAEREEALDLMRRHADELVRSLKSAGLDFGSLAFSNGETGKGQDAESFGVQASSDAAAHTEGADTLRTLSIGDTGRLDIRI